MSEELLSTDKWREMPQGIHLESEWAAYFGARDVQHFKAKIRESGIEYREFCDRLLIDSADVIAGLPKKRGTNGKTRTRKR